MSATVPRRRRGGGGFDANNSSAVRPTGSAGHRRQSSSKSEATLALTTIELYGFAKAFRQSARRAYEAMRQAAGPLARLVLALACSPSAPSVAPLGSRPLCLEGLALTPSCRRTPSRPPCFGVHLRGEG